VLQGTIGFEAVAVPDELPAGVKWQEIPVTAAADDSGFIV